MSDLSGQLIGSSAVVTGGASGFGLGIVRRFVAEGAQVVIADINDAGAQVAEALGCRFCRTDVSSGDSVAQLAAFCGPIDILVNNAGVAQAPQAADEVDVHTFERMNQVNMHAIFHTTRAFVPAMKVQGTGAIVNIASTAGVSPRPGLSWYNASKGWVITATKSLAVELAPYGIRVNAVNPVAGETPMLATFMGGDTAEARERFLATIPLGRFSTPEDVANACLYLASSQASMVTGVALEVDGGRVI